MKKKLRITVGSGTANWLAFSKASDRKRGQYRAKAARRMVELWEAVKTFGSTWQPITRLAPKADSRRRWVRRNLYTFEIGGLVKLRLAPNPKGGSKITEFQVNRINWRKN